METKRTMVLSFHVCRGGRFFNPGHVEFVGEETFSDVCSMLSDRLFTKDRDEHGRFCKPYIADEVGTVVSEDDENGVVIRFQVCIFDILNTAQFI